MLMLVLNNQEKRNLLAPYLDDDNRYSSLNLKFLLFLSQTIYDHEISKVVSYPVRPRILIENRNMRNVGTFYSYQYMYK